LGGHVWFTFWVLFWRTAATWKYPQESNEVVFGCEGSSVILNLWIDKLTFGFILSVCTQIASGLNLGLSWLLPAKHLGTSSLPRWKCCRRSIRCRIEWTSIASMWGNMSQPTRRRPLYRFPRFFSKDTWFVWFGKCFVEISPIGLTEKPQLLVV